MQARRDLALKIRPYDATEAPSRIVSGGHVAVVAGAVVVWSLALRHVDLRAMSDLGLVSVLPFPVFGALVALTASFCLLLRRGRLVTPVVILHVAVLVVLLYGITAVVEDVSRFQVTYRHLGVAEFIARTGDVEPAIDAYFSWPGFFILSALATNLAGVGSAATLAGWAPVFFNLLFLGPLVVLFRTATRDERLVWLGVWLFYLTNWIGQDYYSPQALAYFLYLVALAILVRWFSLESEPGTPLMATLPTLRLPWSRSSPVQSARGQPPAPPAAAAPHRFARAATMAVLIVIVAAMVPTHQLTPFALLVGVLALVVFKRCSARGLPILLAVLIGTWLSFLAITYVRGHVGELAGGIGDVEGTVGQNVGGRLRGSSEHVFVVHARIAVTGVLWLLALLGAARGFVRGRRDISFALLAVAPFTLLGLQPYGGEVLLRAYLFSLPFIVFFTAALFYPRLDLGRSWRMTGMLAAVSLAFLGGFFFTRFGNERMDLFTAQEVSAVRHLYHIAPPGSLLLAGTGNLPWKFEDYERYDYKVVTSRSRWERGDFTPAGIDAVVQDVGTFMKSYRPRGAYLIITRSQKADIDLQGVWPRGSLTRFEAAVRRSGHFEVIYSNRDAQIFVLAQGAEPAA